MTVSSAWGCVAAGRPRRKPDFTDTNQYRAYQSCLLQHFKQHRWLAFIDADEFFVIPHESGSSSSNSSHSSSQNDAGLLSNHQAPSSPPSIQDAQRKGHYELVNQHGTVITQDAVGTELVGPPSPDRSAILNNSMDVPAQNLAVFLSQYESQAALGVNWVLFGSSGHLVRPDAGPLASYTACIPQEHWESTHVKVRDGWPTPALRACSQQPGQSCSRLLLEVALPGTACLVSTASRPIKRPPLCHRSFRSCH